ncbi:MAG: hypothetical protein J6W29_01075 [Neisseriaceae bacterium]|nr:hypothetical protein [Neisseriaceae bacterium]
MLIGWAFLPTKTYGLHKTKDLINAYRRCGGQECPPYNLTIFSGCLKGFVHFRYS